MDTGMMCQPVGALIIGALSGLISVLGYKYLTVIIIINNRFYELIKDVMLLETLFLKIYIFYRFHFI